MAINEGPEQQLDVFIKELFDSRAQLLINQKQDTIHFFYDFSEPSSNSAFEKEIKRSMYVNAWAHMRGILLLDTTSKVDIVHKKVNASEAEVLVFHRLGVSYVYEKQPFPIESFALGTRHTIFLRRDKEQWIVERETYTETIANNPELIPQGSRSIISFPLNHQSAFITKGEPNKRYKAVAYANKYALVALDADKRQMYNPKYKDYFPLGGDCTNFASQVLGDPDEAGALPMNQGWHYTNRNVSKSWVHTDSFYEYLIKSDYGKEIGGGFYDDIASESVGRQSLISSLQPGDLIAYEEKGDIVHFSIVVGKDNQGYQLVNSHTADRYHVPWDLGWDVSTRFHLIQIHY
ncbi:amidase domain-containing protein [Brevibacterium sp. PAMC21349]|nr:amidase domain-containing protein [Brevibacterium sp. PAMC21349]